MKQLLVIFIFLIIIPAKISSGFPGVHGWVGGALDDAFGLPGKMAFGGATKDLRNRLNENIDHLDGVLSKTVGNFNAALQMREDQLDDILSKTVTNLNQSLKANIESLGTEINEGVDGLAKVTNLFNSGLWYFAQGLAIFTILSICIYFIFSTYNYLKNHGRFSRNDFLELLKRISFYMCIFLLSVTFIILFKPDFLGPYINKQYNQEIVKRENNLKNAIKASDIKNACIYAKGLMNLDSNSEYEFVFYKCQIVKSIIYTSDNNNIADIGYMIGRLNNLADNDKKITDPELFILRALHYKASDQSKNSLLKSAIECLNYIEKKEKLRDQKFAMNLEPNVDLLMTQYLASPYNSTSLDSLLQMQKISINQYQYDILTGRKPYKNISANLPDDVAFKIAHISLLKKDQQLLYELIKKWPDLIAHYPTNSEVDKKELQRMQSEIVDNWQNQIHDFINQPSKNYFMHRALDFDEGIASNVIDNAYIRPYHIRNAKLDALIPKLNNQIANNPFLQNFQIQLNYNMGFFKKEILLYLSDNIEDANKLSFAVYVNDAARESRKSYDKIRDLLLNWDNAIKPWPGDPRSEQQKFAYLIRTSAELHFYYDDEGSREPLTYYFIKKSGITKSEWRDVYGIDVDNILENIPD